MEQFISAYEENSEGYSLYQICSIYNDMLRMSSSLTSFFNDDVFKIKSINELLENHNIKISAIARGVAIGDKIEYADEQTLARSILNRRDFSDIYK